MTTEAIVLGKQKAGKKINRTAKQPPLSRSSVGEPCGDGEAEQPGVSSDVCVSAGGMEESSLTVLLERCCTSPSPGGTGAAVLHLSVVHFCLTPKGQVCNI